MNNVILMTDQAVTRQDLFLKLRAQWPKTYDNQAGSTVVEDGDDHVFIMEFDASQEYEPEQLENIMRLMPNPRCFGIDYSNSGFVKRILLAIANDPRIVVDNDAGTVLPGPAFVRRLQEEPEWDWFEVFKRKRSRNNPT